MKINSTQKHWLVLYEQIRKRFRRIISLLLILLVIIIIDGFGNYDKLMQRYLVREQFLSTLPENSEYRVRAGEIYKSKVFDPSDLVNLELPILIKEIEGLSAAISDHLARSFPEEKRSIWGFRVTLVPYVFIVWWGPSILLLLLLLSIRKIRKLHIILLLSAVDNGEIQQKLNSLFYERLTQHYGEGWKKHIIFPSIIILFIALLIPIFFQSMQGGIALSSEVYIDKHGNIWGPREEVPITFDPDASIGANGFLSSSLLSLIIWCLFLVNALKTCSHKILPNSNREGG